MVTNLLCPVFDKSSEFCLAGTDYVTHKDAKKILRVCIKDFECCLRYIELKNNFIYHKRGGRNGKIKQ